MLIHHQCFSFRWASDYIGQELTCLQLHWLHACSQPVTKKVFRKEPSNRSPNASVCFLYSWTPGKPLNIHKRQLHRSHLKSPPNYVAKNKKPQKLAWTLFSTHIGILLALQHNWLPPHTFSIPSLRSAIQGLQGSNNRSKFSYSHYWHLKNVLNTKLHLFAFFTSACTSVAIQIGRNCA